MKLLGKWATARLTVEKYLRGVCYQKGSTLIGFSFEPITKKEKIQKSVLQSAEKAKAHSD